MYRKRAEGWIYMSKWGKREPLWWKKPSWKWSCRSGRTLHFSAPQSSGSCPGGANLKRKQLCAHVHLRLYHSDRPSLAGWLNADWYARQKGDAAVRKHWNDGDGRHRTNWDDASFNWSTTCYAMIRSTWITYYVSDEFFSWLEVSSAKTTFINQHLADRENIDKHYLLKLAPKQFIPYPVS